jgi:hypothetical protein
MPIIRSSRVLYKRLLPVVFGAWLFKLSVWCGAEGCVSGLRAAAAALASITPGRERPEETTICYKISLVQWLIINLNVILYLSTCHTLYISVLILFMIMTYLIINIYVRLMYELKKMERYLRVNLLGPGPRLIKKRIYRAVVSQRLRNTAVE